MRYEGKKTTEISFPLGGIGSGCIGIDGSGRFVDWEIYNRPAKGSQNGYSHFAVKAEADGEVLDARVLHGDVRGSFMGPHMKASYMGYGHGPTTYTMAGLPHFKNCVFDGEFPFAELTFNDEHFPGQVKLTAFNPFIPLNEDDSSIPGAFFEIEFTNYSGLDLTYTCALSCKNPFEKKALNKCEVIDGKPYIHMLQEEYADTDKEYADLCIASDCEDFSWQESWYRAGWKDDFITFWRNFNEYGGLKQRQYSDYSERGGDHCTIAARLHAKPGEKVKCRFVLTWNVPNNYNYWLPYKDGEGEDAKDVTWKNYYAVLFKDSKASAKYSLDNYTRLYGKTLDFKSLLFSQTLPGKIIEAISATICVLKTPTVLRLENGELYGWEGCQEIEGACEGTCTHVWNYAYAVPFLFPRLERSIRDLDYKYNWRDDGKLEFRMALPLGRKGEPFHACVDGQMGGVIKSYRDWKICGDDEWLKKNWERIKGAIAYAWAPTNPDKWDLNRDGILEGRQHNTLDTELFSASSWLEGFYIAALKAAAEIAEHFGETEQAEEYRRLFANGKKYIEENLWNGEYYFQKIDLNDYNLVKDYDDAAGVWNEETKEIKYQIGEGCEIDQIVAQWHSDIIGLGDIFDPERVKKASLAMYNHNFKKSIREHYNPWRLYCLNDEAGAVICEYPKNRRKPTIPLSYAEETMHGFEYQLAALLIKNGMIDKGLEVIAGVRDRYDGEKRNPFNEMECGNNYARNMATFSFIPIISGFTFDMVKGHIGFDPILKGEFKALWSLDSAWGEVNTDGDGYISIKAHDGSLKLNELATNLKEGIGKVFVNGKELDRSEYTVCGRVVKFNSSQNVESFKAVK